MFTLIRTDAKRQDFDLAQRQTLKEFGPPARGVRRLISTELHCQSSIPCTLSALGILRGEVRKALDPLSFQHFRCAGRAG